MRRVQVEPPSFPSAPTEAPLAPAPRALWQVLCGDRDHWRVGLYSPAVTRAQDCPELEQHDCPELFVLLSGRLTLLVAEAGGLRELALTLGAPVLVTAPHTGFCPDGPHQGSALVVERDAFTTVYRGAAEWVRLAEGG